MSRYRTPKKKKSDWKALLTAGLLGVVLIAAGTFLLMSLPEAEPGAGLEVPGLNAPPAGTESAEEAAGEPDPASGDKEMPGDGSPPPNTAETRIGGATLGVGLILMGVLLPVGTFVIDRTSGKKWNRRAGKKHPWKRKI